MRRNSDTVLHNSDYEIKEQDRFLPIANGMWKESKLKLKTHTNVNSWKGDEESVATTCKTIKGIKRMHPRVCFGVYFIHNKSGFR